jgi:hypothetical protein
MTLWRAAFILPVVLQKYSRAALDIKVSKRLQQLELDDCGMSNPFKLLSRFEVKSFSVQINLPVGGERQRHCILRVILCGVLHTMHLQLPRFAPQKWRYGLLYRVHPCRFSNNRRQQFLPMAL